MATERIFSQLMAEIKSGKFVLTGELEPEKTTDLTSVINDVETCWKNKVIACNVTDNPQSCGYISSLAASYVVQNRTGMEIIYQLTCRDRNRLALISELLGAGALGIKNILALTGDYTTLGDVPQSKPVFDLDSTQLIKMIRKMVDEGVDINGKAIEHPPKFHVGGGANPNTKPLEPELLKIKKKADAGVEFIQTQVVFEIEKAKHFLDEVKKFNVPVLVGIMPMKSYGIAEFFDKTVPGVRVPTDLMEKLAKAKAIDKAKRKEAFTQINLEYFIPFIKELKKSTSAAGCHIMSVGYGEVVPSLVEAVK